MAINPVQRRLAELLQHWQAFVDQPDKRLLLWGPAVLIDLLAPFAGYWLPGRGRGTTSDWDIEGGHFTERCEAFIIIALGESIVVTGATAAAAGLDARTVLALALAFAETAALWWVYFGLAAEGSHEVMRSCADPGRLARDAYTYLHVPIIAGIIGVAVADDLLISHPQELTSGFGLAMALGGPALYLLGGALFRARLVGLGSRLGHPTDAAPGVLAESASQQPLQEGTTS